jgi:hypothetical protein
MEYCGEENKFMREKPARDLFFLFRQERSDSLYYVYYLTYYTLRLFTVREKLRSGGGAACARCVAR